MNLLDDIESSHVDIQSTFVTEDRMYYNPDEWKKILFPEDGKERLLVISGNNIAFHPAPNTEHNYIWWNIRLVEDILRMHPSIGSLRFVVYDTEHTPGMIKKPPHTINIAFSFCPEVRTYYKAMKMLNDIRHIFFGTIGGSGFETPYIYYTKDDSTLVYCTCMNFYFFNWIRNDKHEDSDYLRFKPMFDACGLPWDDKNHKSILKDAIDRMDNRREKFYRKLINVT